MKQVQFQNFGQTNATALCVDVADIGPPASWEVVVDVEAFPIHCSDVSPMTGKPSPVAKFAGLSGNEAVGRVSSVGQGVKHLRLGERVILLANHPWSERLKLPAAAVHPVGDQTDPLQLSMLRISPVTAYLLLRSVATLRPGDWVVQTAPLSSVGQCIVQLAKIFGVGTINIVQATQDHEAVLRLGGDAVLTAGPNTAWHVKAIKGNDPLRFAFDAVAGPGTQILAECLDEGGQIINYSALSNEPCSIASDQTIYRGITLSGLCSPRVLNRMSFIEQSDLFQKLESCINDGKLRLAIDSTYPIHDIQSAMLRASQTDRTGQVIVTTQFVPSSPTINASTSDAGAEISS